MHMLLLKVLDMQSLHCILLKAYLSMKCLQPCEALLEAVLLHSRSASPPLDDLVGTIQETPDGARAVLSSKMKADIVSNEVWVQKKLQSGVCPVMV